MAVRHIESFELDVNDQFTVAEEGEDFLSLTCADPVLVVRCAVLESHPDALDGRGALLAISSVGDQHLEAGGRILKVFKHGSQADGIVLEDEQSLERILTIAVQHDHKVLLVQCRTPTHLATAAEELVTELVGPLVGRGVNSDGETA